MSIFTSKKVDTVLWLSVLFMMIGLVIGFMSSIYVFIFFVIIGCGINITAFIFDHFIEKKTKKKNA